MPCGFTRIHIITQLETENSPTSLSLIRTAKQQAKLDREQESFEMRFER